jgi:hypothetical protein
MERPLHPPRKAPEQQQGITIYTGTKENYDRNTFMLRGLMIRSGPELKNQAAATRILRDLEVSSRELAG